MYIKKIVFLALSLRIIAPSSGCEYHSRLADYDTAWREGKFSGQTLRDVERLTPSGKLNDSMKMFLADSLTLKNLRILDLSNQGINDDFIEQISNNPTFSRVMKIDLTGNPDITSKALEYISDSPFLGSVRDLPQVSARYGVYSSEIRVVATGTDIASEVIKVYNEKPQNCNFLIHYLNPVTEQPLCKPAVKAIKWLFVESDDAQS